MFTNSITLNCGKVLDYVQSVTSAKTCRNRPSYSEMMKFSQQQVDMFGGYDDDPISCFCGD